MNMNDLSTQLLFSTVRLVVTRANGSPIAATGFFFSIQVQEEVSLPFLITNRHVIEGAQDVVFSAHLDDGGKPVGSVAVEVARNKSVWFSLGKYDLAACPIAPTLLDMEQGGKTIFFRSISADIVPKRQTIDDLAALEDVVFIGYPNALEDSKNNLPIIRKGITATPIWNNYEGEPCFLVDAEVFEGSSGSPVFILNQGSYATPSGLAIGTRILFVGIIAQTMLKNGEEHLGLGKCINSEAFLEELSKVSGRLISELNPDAS